MFPGCFTNITSATECRANNGTYDVNELGNVQVCWLQNENQTSCKDDTLCDPAEDICQPFCYVTSIVAAQCDCAEHTTVGDTYYTICNRTNTALTYDSAKGTPRCVISREVYSGTSSSCLAVAGGGTSWYRGGYYQAPHLNDAASCTASGVCSAEGASTEGTCETATACSVACPGCDANACSAAGALTKLSLRSSADVTCS